MRGPALQALHLAARRAEVAAGTYQLTVADLVFPVALSSLQLIVLNHCGTTPGCMTAPVSPTPSAGPAIAEALTLAAGTYDLFVLAAADSTALQGLYSIQIVQGSTAAYAATVPVGQLPAANPISLTAGATVSLQLTDLAAPAALSSIQGIATQGASVLQALPGAGTYSFAAAAGTVQLYVLAQPGSGGQGTYEAYATAGSQVLADIAQPVLAMGSSGYAFSAPLTAGGSYQVSVYDFQEPVAFTSLSAVIAQRGAALTTTQGTASFTAVAGPLNILVFPVAPSSTANGLFGVQVSAQGSGATAFETTQGVGALFSSQTVSVTAAGFYDLTLTDLAFPAKLSNLALIATRGDSVVGQIFGAGKVTISTTPGNYVLNVLAQVGTGVDYGLYGLQMAPTPPAPTVTLTASASSITSGKSVTLTWSSSGTSSCSASANPTSSVWAGALPATSGSESSGALTATTSFSLSCTGTDGTSGTASASVTVNPATSHSSGGGGMSRDMLFVLMLALILQLSRRRVTLAGRH